MIPKGTTVRVRTTNGGEVTAPLDQNHRHTYDAIIVIGDGYRVIPSWRIESVEPV